jgi:hypothetical protein
LVEEGGGREVGVLDWESIKSSNDVGRRGRFTPLNDNLLCFKISLVLSIASLNT